MKIETVIAASRFGLGACPGELPGIDKDPRHWLLEQLGGPARQPDELKGMPNTASILLEVQKVREMRRDAKASSDEPSPDVVKQFGNTVRQHYLQQTDARYLVSLRCS